MPHLDPLATACAPSLIGPPPPDHVRLAELLARPEALARFEGGLAVKKPPPRRRRVRIDPEIVALLDE